MKLAKKISKGIALCAVLTIISVWGGVLTSCSNGSEDPDPVPTPKDEDVPEGWSAITVGDIEKYDGNGGTASYTVTKNSNGSITISHDAAMAKYASCSFKTNFGDSNTLYTKITNNSDVAATVQVQVNKAGTEANGYQPTPTVTAVYVDGEKQSRDDVKYSVEVSIPAKGSVVIANKFDPSENPDTVAISLNSQESVFGTVAKGNITVSGISMKNVTDESELETTETGAGQGGGTGTGDGTGGEGQGSGGGSGGQGNGGNQSGGSQGQGEQQGSDGSNQGGGNQGQGIGGGDGGQGSSSELDKTSIIEGIQAGDNVWGSGTSITKSGDVYVVVAGKGWDPEGIASIPVCFDEGDLDGSKSIVIDGVDISGFKLRNDTDEHPSIELKIIVGDDDKVEVINATSLLKEGKIEIPLADVKADILKEASKVMLSFRGTGTVKIKDISKAKAKDSSSSSSGNQVGQGGGNQSSGEDNNQGGNNDNNQGEGNDEGTSSELKKTSIIGGIVDGDNVWGSGTKTVKEADGSYTVTAAGEGEGTWGGNIAAIPVCFSAGDLVGFSHIVAEVDISGFTLNQDTEEHPSIELKIANDDDTKVKIINATKLLKEGKIGIPLADVEADILKDSSRVILSFRGTGTVKIKDISKAK